MGILPLRSQTDLNDLFEMSIEELLGIEVTVASKVKETNRETPSIITVITHEEIRDNHCRDMIDVLNMIPGFVISKDEDYSTFLSRGLYGFEGRTLFMVDDMQLSDLYFGAYIIGNDFPIHLIERIEIIRGPGSVLYGGLAELAVIKIVTQKENKGGTENISVRYGQLPSTIGHADVGFNLAKVSNNFSISALGFYGIARRTDANASYIGNSTSFKHNEKSAGLETASLVLNSSYKNTHIGILFNHYKNKQVRSFEVDPNQADLSPTDRIYASIEEGTAARKVEYTYTTFGTNLSHELQLNEKLKMIPSINYHYNFPFKRDVPREEVVIQRMKPSILAIYSSENYDVNLGGEYFFDAAKIIRPTGALPVDYFRKSVNHNGSDAILISNYSAFGNFKYKYLNEKGLNININAGFRFDWNELYGSKFNPRVALNLVSGKFHSKLLYSSAFRAPMIANNAFSRYGMNPDPDLYSRNPEGVKPEETNVYEFEIGYLFKKNLFFVSNFFYQTVNNIIEFRYNYMNADLYSDNGGKIGTYGVETELKYVSSKYKANINLSFVKPQFFADTNPWAYSYEAPKGGDTYIAPDNINGLPSQLQLLALSAVKLYTNFVVNFTKRIALNINGLYVADRRTYNGNGESRVLSQQYIFGGGLSISNIFKHFNIDVSVHDIFNERLNIATAWYDSTYDVLPYKGREFTVSIGYKF